MFMLCIYLRNALFFALLYNAILFQFTSDIFHKMENSFLFLCTLLLLLCYEMHSISQATESLQNN